MQKFSIYSRELATSPWRKRGPAKVAVEHEAMGPDKGASLGAVRSFFPILAMLAADTFAFVGIVTARRNAGGQSKTEFAPVWEAPSPWPGFAGFPKTRRGIADVL